MSHVYRCGYDAQLTLLNDIPYNCCHIPEPGAASCCQSLLWVAGYSLFLLIFLLVAILFLLLLSAYMKCGWEQIYYTLTGRSIIRIILPLPIRDGVELIYQSHSSRVSASYVSNCAPQTISTSQTVAFCSRVYLCK